VSPSRKLDREKDNGRERRTILRRKRLFLCYSLAPILQELEKLEEQLAETKLEIEKYKGQGQSHDTARKKILLELEEKLNKTEEREAQYEVKYQRTMKAIGHIKQVVGSTFNKIGGQQTRCDT
jgi:chromosome segregation ATPase